MLDQVRDLYEYNRWANQRLLDAMVELPEDEFTRDRGNSFASIRDTLVHILSAEWVWLRRWTGISPAGIPDSWDTETLSAIRAMWVEVDREMSEFLVELKESSLGAVIDYRNTAGAPFSAPLWELLLHVVNHSSYHRGQVVTMIRQSGRPAVSTDFLLFCRER